MQYTALLALFQLSGTVHVVPDARITVTVYVGMVIKLLSVIAAGLGTH